MLNQINLGDVRTFVLIGELGSFTKAAEALEVSRSHVSKQITQLEKQMGVTLLIRTTRTLKLTDAGELFFNQCQNHLSGIEQAIHAAVDDVDQMRGHINLNCVGGHLGEDIIAPMVAKFMRQYPDITVNMDFSSHRIDLIKDDFDVAIRMGELEDAGFIGRQLLSLEMVTLASPEYLNHNRAALNHPKDLLSHNCLTGSVKKWHYQSLTKPIEDIDVTVSGQFECKNGRSLVNAALAGCGLIRVPKLYCQAEIEQAKLVEVMPEWKIPNVSLSVIYHKDRYQPKRLQALLKHFQQQFSQLS
ncbi:LysR family transcriptional regulator [Vibrio rumoiensis]|uniref:LysR family transcriptional regulator n=1 Tax=Vibrio rumoiensis TaxID=76258 RepID=UPI000B5CA2ED|nr:LysR family transcriptional regulator [Vibrio rumoiensis]